MDKATGKLIPWQGRFITTAGRTTQVKAVLTSLATYHITALVPCMGTLSAFEKIERAFLWAGSDKVSGGQCKVSWNLVCRPKRLGGLGVLNLRKYARALRLRWAWYEWKKPNRAWVNQGKPCDNIDMDLFYATTTITIGNNCMAKFWHSLWLNGRKPKDISPSIFLVAKKEEFNMRDALRDLAWIARIDMSNCLFINHIQQFYTLWAKFDLVLLHEDVPMLLLGTSPPTGCIWRPPHIRYNLRGPSPPPWYRRIRAIGCLPSANSLSPQRTFSSGADTPSESGQSSRVGLMLQSWTLRAGEASAWSMLGGRRRPSAWSQEKGHLLPFHARHLGGVERKTCKSFSQQIDDALYLDR